jgi:hypothetical protein
LLFSYLSSLTSLSSFKERLLVTPTTKPSFPKFQYQLLNPRTCGTLIFDTPKQKLGSASPKGNK